MKNYDKIILNSNDISENIIEKRRYALNEITKEVDFSKVENLFIDATRKCREKAKKIYESLPEEIKNSEDWIITGYLKAYPDEGDPVLNKVFSSSNPFYKGEKFRVFCIYNKDTAQETLYNPEEFKITLMPWNVQVWNELYLFVCLCKFPAQDIMKIIEVYSEVVLEYYGED